MPRRPVSKTREAQRMLNAFAKRLAAARIAAGYASQRELATKLGMSQPTYSRYERAETWPMIDTLHAICLAVDKPADWLIFGIGPAVRPTHDDDLSD